LCHESAFLDGDKVLAELRDKYARLHDGAELKVVRVAEADVSIADAVSTYLFNSQLVALPDGKTLLVAPRECEENESVRDYIASLVEEAGAIDDVRYFDLRQSMNGGGGPACLRLRVVLDEAEEKAIAPGVLFCDALDGKLAAWIERHYRDRLQPRDFADPRFVDEIKVALDELTGILGLGSIYPFQLGDGA
jgi:succinylarginine dihydrolase